MWDVVGGASELTVSLLDAAAAVDTGDIWSKRKIELRGDELYDEINELVFEAEFALMDWAIDNFGAVQPEPQQGEATYFRRRVPDDSRIDPHLSIAEQFDLLRVADPNRFPAFFELRGARYSVKIDRLVDPQVSD